MCCHLLSFLFLNQKKKSASFQAVVVFSYAFFISSFLSLKALLFRSDVLAASEAFPRKSLFSSGRAVHRTSDVTLIPRCGG